MDQIYDLIVIGSGPAGVHSALAAAERGLRVCILDGGLRAPSLLHDERVRNFEDMRRSVPDQWRWFLGADYSGIPVHGLQGGHGGGMTSGNRSYVTDRTDQYLPLHVENGTILQSLAQGGLAAAWGGACAYMPAHDLQAMGLSVEQINKAYDEVAAIIGVSGPMNHPHVQPPVPLDHHAQRAMNRAERKQKALSQSGLRLLQPHTALLTQKLGDRSPTRLNDMDYYADPGKSLYRPQYTLDHLRTLENVDYVDNCVVQHIEEGTHASTVFCTSMNPSEERTIRRTAKQVILAAGALNTARILLASLGQFDAPVPFIAKPHAYAACLDIAALGKTGPRERSSVCQLVLLDEQESMCKTESACAQLYSYRSLLLFRLRSSLPLAVPHSLAVAALLSPALVIADIRFPAPRLSGQTLTLRRIDGATTLSVRCIDARSDATAKSLRRIKHGLRQLGMLPVRSMWMSEGSASHYAGTVPIDTDDTLPLSCDEHGRVRQMKRVFVADAAAFRLLPPLPHTFTIMAYARTVGAYVAENS